MLFRWVFQEFSAALEIRNNPFSANRLGRNLTTLSLEKYTVFSILIFFSRQYSKKSEMLRKCRFGVSYHLYGRDGVTGVFPLKNSK